MWWRVRRPAPVCHAVEGQPPCPGVPYMALAANSSTQPDAHLTAQCAAAARQWEARPGIKPALLQGPLRITAEGSCTARGLQERYTAACSRLACSSAPSFSHSLELLVPGGDAKLNKASRASQQQGEQLIFACSPHIPTV